MPDIFDNLKTESAIGPALKSALTAFDTCDVATGYLDLRGWASFADIVDAKSAGSAATATRRRSGPGRHGDAGRLGGDARGTAGRRAAAAVRLGHQRHAQGAGGQGAAGQAPAHPAHAWPAVAG